MALSSCLFLTKVVKPITANNSVQPLAKTILNMKTFFNQKTWLYALSLAILSSNTTVSIFAQDSNTSTNRKVTGILKNSDKEITISPERSVSQLSKSDAAYYLTNKIDLDQGYSPKPKLGVLLKGSETGAVILKTFPNTAAAEIGLQENDKIISINGKNIENIASLTEVIQDHKVGDAIVVKYEREGSKKTASSILRAASKDHYLSFRRNYNYNYDYNYSNNTKYQKETACEELEKMYGEPFLGVYLSNPHEESGDGARLTSIIEGTGAESAILKADDKITKMDKSPISSSKAAIEFIQSKKPGDKITIQVVRENKTMLIKATLGSWADSPSSTSKIKILEAYCEANTAEAEVPAPKENTSNTLMPSFETQAVMEVFPNPTADFVTIKFEGKKAPLAIQIISLNGQSMYTKNVQNFDGNYNDQLDLSQYPSGVYLIHLTQGDQQITQQVVVE